MRTRKLWNIEAIVWLITLNSHMNTIHTQQLSTVNKPISLDKGPISRTVFFEISSEGKHKSLQFQQNLLLGQ